jgi:hemerythrin
MFLVDYAKGYFRTEEAIMLAAGHPATLWHRLLHRSRELEMAKTVYDQENGTALVTMGTLHFLDGWLSGHILTEDFIIVRNIRSEAAGSETIRPAV